MPYNPTNLSDSYTVNAQCHLAWYEPFVQTDTESYPQEKVRVEIIGSYHFYCDSPVNRDIVNIEDITSGVTWDLNYPANGQGVQWFTSANTFKIVGFKGGPGSPPAGLSLPSDSGERTIELELANGQKIQFDIFVRGWKHLQAEFAGAGGLGLGATQVNPDCNGSDGTFMSAGTVFPNGDRQFNPALRFDNMKRNGSTLAPSTVSGPLVQADYSSAEIGRPVGYSGITGAGAGANGFAYNGNTPVLDLQRSDNWGYAVTKNDADDINKVTLNHPFYHGRVYFKPAYGSGPASETHFQSSPWRSSLFQIQDGVPAETERTAIFVYETIDHAWQSVLATTGNTVTDTILNHEQDNSTSPITGPRSYRREVGLPDPAPFGNANGPYEPYWTNTGTVSSIGAQTGDYGLGSYRAGAWGNQIPSGGSISITCNASKDSHYTNQATTPGPTPPNNGTPFPDEGFKAIWLGGGEPLHGESMNTTCSSYDDVLAEYSQLSPSLFNYQRLVPPLVSMTLKTGALTPQPPDPCAVSPLTLDNTNTTSTNCTAFGSNDGSAVVNETILIGNGSTAPFIYVWVGPSGPFGGNSNNQTGLIPGNYSVKVTDANGCEDDWLFTITEPGPPPPCDIICNTSVSYGCSSATLNFNADLSSGTPYQDWVITVLDPNGNTLNPSTLTIPGGSGGWGLPGATGNTIINGTYSYTITDVNDASCFVSGTIPNVVVPTNTVNLTATSTDATSLGANDGTATALVSGGTAPFGYSWSNGQTGSTINNLAPGPYTVTVTDSNGCTANASVTIDEPLQMPLNAQPLDVCLNLDTGKFDFVDNNNYSPSGTVYPYRIAITIDHGSGVNVYPGSLASPDIFSDSDLTVLRTYDSTIQYGMNNNINIPTSGPNYISDIYKITTVWNFTGGNTIDHTTVSYVNAQGLQLFNDLAITLSLKYSCAGDLTSWDKTDYSINGIPYTLDRTHELFAPVASGLPSPAYSSGQAIINSDLYEGTWTSSITSYVVWSVPQLPVLGVVYDPMCIKKTFYKTKTKNVSCYIDPCVVHHHSKKIKNKYDAAICDRDIVKIKEYRFKYQRLIELLKIYIIGELGDCAEDYTELWKMLEITNIDKITNPDCCGDPAINQSLIADGKGNYSQSVCNDTGSDSGDGTSDGDGGDGNGDDEGDGCPCIENAVAWAQGQQSSGVYVLGDYVNFTTATGDILCFQLHAAPSSWVTPGSILFILQSPLTDLGQYWEYIPCDGDGGDPTFGCTDPGASNYNDTADYDDGSCVYPVSGCTDPTATNYNPLATIDDGSCIYCIYGCMNPSFLEFDPTATCPDDTQCITACIYGCTDPGASNYNSLATCDDGSCDYCSTPGCMDPAASNYDPLACIPQDWTCIYAPLVFCCTDPAAVNYNANPTCIEDGSCLYSGCTDPLADNTTPAFVHPITGQVILPIIDDGSCTYSSSCTGDLAIPDDTFEMELELLGYSNGTLGDNIVLLEGAGGPIPSVCALQTLNLNSTGIGNFTGIESFTGLLQLFIGGNPFSSIDVTALTLLTDLWVNYSSITSIDLSNNTALKKLRIGNTSITSIDLSNNILLEYLSIDNTSLSGTVDVSANVNLMFIDISNNPAVTVLDLGSNINLSTLALHAFGLSSSATIKVGTSGRVTLANSLFTVAGGHISTGTTFII